MKYLMALGNCWKGIVIVSFFGCFGSNVSGQNIDDLSWKLDSIITMGIDSMAFPGAQLIVANKDSIFIAKSYGHHTYDRITKVENHHLYDLASVTKVTSGLLVLMKMVEADLINLDQPVSDYLPLLCRSNKKKLTLREMLAHQAGLVPYIKFWESTLKKDGTFKRKTFKKESSKDYPIKIMDSMYLHKKYPKKMFKAIKKSKVIPVDSVEYRYSGLLFLLMPELIENVLKTNFEQQLKVNIFDKLELKKIGYRPLERFPKSQIVPTEKDTFFRKSIVQGYVHDEAAAMLNSKSCNAGLFSNAGDVAQLFQMLMNEGTYKQRHILSDSIIREFTSYQFPEKNNRRGLGFDKPLLEYSPENAYIAKSASPSSFGHSGFTGTFVWADPQKNLLVVFLSNRVYPTRAQRKLYSLNIRPQIHQACYNYIEKLNFE